MFNLPIRRELSPREPKLKVPSTSETAISVNLALAKELQETKTELSNVKEQCDDLQAVNTQKRKFLNIELETNQTKHENKKLKQENEKLKSDIAVTKAALKNAKARESYREQRTRQPFNEKKLEDALAKCRSQIEKLKEIETAIVNKLETVQAIWVDEREENEWLRELLQVDKVKVVKTFQPDSHMFTDECRLCIYKLLNKVSTRDIPSVIETVFDLAGCKANKLPNFSTIKDWNIEHLYAAQVQLKEIVPQKINTTLMSDETSKLNMKVQGYHLSDKKGNKLVLGLRDIETKSGSDTLSTFKEVLADLDSVTSHPSNRSEVGQKMNVRSSEN